MVPRGVQQFLTHHNNETLIHLYYFNGTLGKGDVRSLVGSYIYVSACFPPVYIAYPSLLLL